MPTNKDFKRLVRRRMLKTGEAYTTARLRLFQRNPSMNLESEVRSPENTTLPSAIAAPASGRSTPDYAVEPHFPGPRGSGSRRLPHFADDISF